MKLASSPIARANFKNSELENQLNSGLVSNVAKTTKRIIWRKAKFVSGKSLPKFTQEVLTALQVSGLYLTGTEDPATKMKIQVSILLRLLNIFEVMPDI